MNRVNIQMNDGIAIIQMNRKDKINALDLPMIRSLIEAAEGLKREKGLSAVILSGEGKGFSAGLDTQCFAEAKELPLTRDYGDANIFQHVALVWRQVPVPVIAAIHGVAFGAGFQLALGADMRYVTPDAQLSIMEIKWGLVPDMAGNILMRQLASMDLIRELTYTGRVFSGSEALTYGFATRISADPLADALATASEISKKNPDAIRAIKRLANLSTEATPKEILIAETREQLALLGTPNQREAALANTEKRAPRFS